MGNLKESIRSLIEKEKKTGRFSVLDEIRDVDLLEQIFLNYKKINDLREVEEGEELPRKGNLIFVAAPTGAGKDSLVARLCYQEPEKKYIELNMDIFRHYFPRFIGNPKELTDRKFAIMTNEFAYEMYYIVQEILLQEFPGTNIIITGTLRETDWVEETFKRFKNDTKTDYRVRLVCLAVPKKESAISVIERYIRIVKTQKEDLEKYPGTARYTSLQYHDETYERFPTNLEYFQKKFEEDHGKLIDSIEVHKRAKRCDDFSENTRVFSTEEIDEEERTAINAVMQLRLKPYKISYEHSKKIIDRIKENKDYLKSQNILIEVIRDLAIILDYPKIVNRIDENYYNKKIQSEPRIN